MSQQEFDGPIRVEIESVMLFSRATGDVRTRNGLYFSAQNGNGRWKRFIGPVVAVEENHDPTRADLLEAAARIVRAHDEGAAVITEEER